MAKAKTSYVCSSCGTQSNAWSGKCFSCGEWETLELLEPVAASSLGGESSGHKLKPSSVDEANKSSDITRIKTTMPTIDEVLGGGFVRGSVVLLAGQPGVGKSTLLLQLAAGVSNKQKVLYVSGEESLHQVATRSKRLGLESKNLKLANSTSADDIAATISSAEYELVIVDSIQTIATSTATGVQGGVSQVVHSTHQLLRASKNSNVTILLVGHVTKEGNIAGPKLLEHLVDVVLQLEGDKFAGFKLLRGTKNRYGSIDEVAVLEMDSKGLSPVSNPSKALLEERQVTDGSIIFPAMEGTKPLLVEVQALTNKSVYGYPKRTSVGFSQNRLNLLVAVLEKRTRLDLSDVDVYLSVSAGISIDEPAADLAVCMAIASSATGHSLDKDATVYGEVGLGGEIRQVQFSAQRDKESTKLGFKTIIGPGKNKQVKDLRGALLTYLKKQ